MVGRDIGFAPSAQAFCSWNQRRQGDVWPFRMNQTTLNLWRQIESGRRFGKKRLWPTVSPSAPGIPRKA